MNKFDPNATVSDNWPGDFYGFRDELPAEDRKSLDRLRAFMEGEIKPIINEYWQKDETPRHLVPKLAELEIAGIAFEGYGYPGRSKLLAGWVSVEMARIDPSTATFVGVHGGLATASIMICGSDEQKERWLPRMAKMEIIGAFGLTEPDVGSAVAGGLTTTCRRDGEDWVLNGQKKWIGNAPFADLVIIWARDEDDDQVKGFVVETPAEGFAVEKMQGKIALRAVENGLITMTDCRVPNANKLEHANSFEDTTKVLSLTRGSVAWQAVGCAMGAFEHAVAYAKTREQFGKPIGSFQLVQSMLAKMCGNVTAGLALVHRLAELQNDGRDTDAQDSIAKVQCCRLARETVALAREMLGGNGILLEHNVARYFVDCEAIYSYEGTNEINSLIVGRELTEISAFV